MCELLTGLHIPRESCVAEECRVEKDVQKRLRLGEACEKVKAQRKPWKQNALENNALMNAREEGERLETRILVHRCDRCNYKDITFTPLT